MTSADPGLTEEAARFADEIADLLHQTVCDDPPVAAEVGEDGRVVVAAYADDGSESSLPLVLGGKHRLDLRVRFRCSWDFTGRFLAISESAFSLALPHLREPLVRVEYQRNRRYAPAHIQVHAESSALGHLLAWQELEQPPKVQLLHLPVGGRRFRPALEDVIEFAVEDLGVEVKDGWRQRVESGRSRWRRVQLAAALRDVIKEDPDSVPDELRRAIDDAHQAVIEAANGGG